MELDKLKTKDAVVAPKPQKQEHRFLGTVIRRPGLTLFEYNSKSKTVQVAEVNTQHSYRYNEKTKNLASVAESVCKYVTGVCTFKR